MSENTAVCTSCEELKELLRAFINVLAIYDVKHCDFPINLMLEFMRKSKITGLAIDDKRALYIDKNQGLTEIRSAIVHEMRHAHHYLQGDFDTLKLKQIENRIEKETDKIIEKVYGC